ncbi:MAG: peptidase S41, partial [Erythrobacter sp.]|nr:peptidase S41 [Erythrobacter sp.]
MIKRSIAAALLTGSIMSTQAQAETRLLRDPALSDNALAFAYAGDLWIAAADGSNPRRLTSHPGNERDPIFSPDGTMIAFTANYDGNDDVFVIDTAGGTPRRLTWHPGNDLAVDWTPDGKSVALTSARERDNGRSAQLYHVAIDGGLPQKVSQARIASGSYDENGRIFAAVPGGMAYNGLVGGSSGWRGYRGGSAPSIQLLDFAGKTATTIPGDRTTEFDPHWMGGQLYFLSDREDKVFNIFRYNPADGSLVKVSDETVWDIRRFDAHGGAIVYEAGGQLKRLDPATGAVAPLAITLNADLPQRQPQWKDLAEQIESAELSPSGKRVAITARGEVFTVPTDKGAVRNISQSAPVRDYTGIWSDDGSRIAYITDDGSAQTLVIEDQSGIEPVRRIPLGSDFYELVEWGDGGKHIVYSSNKLKLFAMNVASGVSWQIAESERRNGDFAVVISPKGRWLAYTTRGETYNAALHLYDLETRKSYPATGNFADITSPEFSKDGKLLFFAASTNAGPQQLGLDMSSQQQPYRAGLYAVVLEVDGKSPLAPVLADEEPEEADKEKDKSAKEKKDKGEAKDDAVKVEPVGLRNRTVALPLAEGAYGSLATEKDGALYYVELVQPGVATGPGSGQERARLMRFDFDEREAKPVGDGIVAVSTNREGDLLLLRKHDDALLTAKAGEKLEPEPVSLAGLKLLVDPAAEWRQIFGDVWRMEKAYFYAENMHGLDWDAVRVRYEPLLEHVGRREDLNELLVEMIAEMQVGHNRVGGGEVYESAAAKPGLLGADFRIENGRYRIARIFDGEQWNPFLAAPLAAPGVDVKQGDYILAINGRELGAADNIYAALAGTAGTQVTLTVANSPN